MLAAGIGTFSEPIYEHLTVSPLLLRGSVISVSVRSAVRLSWMLHCYLLVPVASAESDAKGRTRFFCRPTSNPVNSLHRKTSFESRVKNSDSRETVKITLQCRWSLGT
jgi:hypothetical protein